jgi:Methyltransferase domain
VFFVATGERCRREAAEAIGCLRESNPGLAVTVFTDDAAGVGLSGVTAVELEQPRFSLADKLDGFLRAPYARNLFLDTDAFVVGDTGPLFRLLDRFDVAASHAHGHSGARFHDYESPELPETFPQLNTGVVAFRRTAAVSAMLRRWLELYEANPHHRHDQPSFRQALYESGLSSHVLPPEWNLLVGGAYLSGPVGIVHGHGLTAVAARALAGRLNERTGPRLLLPSGEVVPALPGAVRPEPAAVVSVSGPVHSVPARADIPRLLNRLGLRGAGVEVGVKEGKYSAAILTGWQGRLLISIDPWLEAPDGTYVDIANVPQARQEAFLAAARERLAPFGERSEIWRLTGDEAARRIPDGTLDFVYLDARHDYVSVCNDLAAWFPKVAPGGVIAGHDYVDGELREGIFGVRSAVDEFFGARGLPVGVTTAEPATFPSWIVAVPSGEAHVERRPGALVIRSQPAERAQRLHAGRV